VSKANLRISKAVLTDLEQMAHQEGCSVEELVSELLTQAIQKRQQADATWDRWQTLSNREQEIIALHCLGYSGAEISQRLTLSLNTIKTHLSNGMHKLGISTRSDLRKALAEWDFAGWLKVEPRSLDGYAQAFLPGFSYHRKRRL
jgi:DNA-binding NarL/FixJ family response regulator